MGSWRTAQRQMRGLTPVAEVAAGLAADDTMVGLHVRTVFDAPRDDVTARTALGEEAVRAAESEYGTEGARRLMQWRKAAHWSNFVPRIAALLQVRPFRSTYLQHIYPQYTYHLPTAHVPSFTHGLITQEDAHLKFYLAADSKDAYDELSRRRVLQSCACACPCPCPCPWPCPCPCHVHMTCTCMHIHSGYTLLHTYSMPARSTRCSKPLHTRPTHPLQALPRPYTSDGAALRQRAVRLPGLRRDALLAHRHDESRAHQIDTRFRYRRHPLAPILPRRYYCCRVSRLHLRCVCDLNSVPVTLIP